MRNRMMVSIFSMSVAAVSAAANLNAAECVLGSDCEGNQICIDGACAVSEVPQKDCSDVDACGWGEICDQGVCKPEGVMCANDWGHCVVWETGSECTCADGTGQGSNSASDDGSDGLDVSEPEPIAPDALYAMCIDQLASSCSAPPDLSDVCADDVLASCTEYLTTLLTLEGNCVSDDPVSTEPTGLDTDVSVDEPPPPDGTTNEDTAGSAEDAWADIATAFAVEPPALSPWALADCCQQWASLEAEEQEFVDCLVALAPDNCEGFGACMELVRGDIGLDGDGKSDGEDDVGYSDTEVGGDVDDDGEAAGDSETENGADDDTDSGDEDTGADDDNDDSKATSGTESSGCSFVPVSRNVTTMDLVRALF